MLCSGSKQLVNITCQADEEHQYQPAMTKQSGTNHHVGVPSGRGASPRQRYTIYELPLICFFRKFLKELQIKKINSQLTSLKYYLIIEKKKLEFQLPTQTLKRK